jgi:hypothetical protein
VALFSYEGKLCWGFNADYALVPNLDEFVDDIRWSFEQLRGAVVASFLERRTASEPAEERSPQQGAGAVAPQELPADTHELRLVDREAQAASESRSAVQS